MASSNARSRAAVGKTSPVTTGYHDYNPLTVSSAVTFLVDTEAQWIKTKVQEGSSKGLRTCLLSHHQAFSAFERIGNDYVNEKLLAQLGGVLNKVDLWFWGHEHRLDVYDEYLGVKRGRCLGCSAVPVFVQDDYFVPKCPSVPLLGGSQSKRYSVKLGNDGETYHLAYVIISVDRDSAQIDYYEPNNGSSLLFSEQVQ